VRIRRAAPWVILAASMAGCGVLGPGGLKSSVGDMLSAYVFMLAAGWLLVRGARGLIARRRWRRQGGRVIARQDGPTVAELAQRIDGVREQAARANARLDGHDAVWDALGAERVAQVRREQMRRDNAPGA
jgi:hypothetical protein